VVTGTGGTVASLPLKSVKMFMAALQKQRYDTDSIASLSSSEFNASMIVVLESPVKNTCPF
jgi:hypothetical protein